MPMAWRSSDWILSPGATPGSSNTNGAGAGRLGLLSLGPELALDSFFNFLHTAGLKHSNFLSLGAPGGSPCPFPFPSMHP